MQYWLATSPWYGVILWMVLYISDYYLTIYTARGFRETGHFQFEGSFELTPLYQKDIDHLRPISKLHLLLLFVSSVVILIVWWITRLHIFLEWAYPLYLGMFLLLEVAVHFRHLRNMAMLREIKKNGGVEGQITYRRWFSYRHSANELYITGTFFLLTALLTYSLFFLGGAIMCYGMGFRHSQMARKARVTALAASHNGMTTEVKPQI